MEIFPLASFLLLIGIYSGSWRERFLLASLSWGLVVLALTELLSLWQGLTRPELALGWSAVLLVLMIRIYFFRPSWPPIPKIDLRTTFLIIFCIGILLVTAFIAYVAAPNNWDSMTYHLGRIAHWKQDRTVEPYPTAILRQIFYPPWSSYAMLQFYILTGNDQWLNFVQWFSSLGSMIGASLIARRLNGNGLAQAMAALLTATIPMGILQSTSTQSDYVVSFWLVVFIYFGLCLIEENRLSFALAAGLSLGLAGLVKGTGYIYAAPFLIWIFVGGLIKYRQQFLKPIAVVILAMLLINSSYYFRNLSATGRILPPTENNNIITDKFDPQVLGSNFLLNFGLHGATTWYGLNRWMEDAVAQGHAWLGIDEGDPRVGMVPGVKFQILDTKFRYHEDYAGNFYHTLLIIFCLAAGLLAGRRITPRSRGYVLSLLAGILFFVMTVKWSPFHSRYHLPEFILFTPFLAVVVYVVLRSWGTFVLGSMFFLAALPWTYGNSTRPLIGIHSILTTPRIEQYFMNNAGDASYFYPLEIADHFNCRQIGLSFSENTWEYPLWIIAKSQHREDTRFEHIMVNNASSGLSYPLGAFDPCVIIKEGSSNPDVLPWQGKYFRKVYDQGGMTTYLSLDL